MVKFLASKDLLFLVDFSPASLDSVRDYSAMDVNHVLTIMRQCPSYQIDPHHTNCGLRTRLLPVLDYIQSMLSSNIVGVVHRSWGNDRAASTWVSDSQGDDAEDGRTEFRFTRSLSGDQRLRFEGAMATDRMARRLFTATEWDWTPEN